MKKILVFDGEEHELKKIAWDKLPDNISHTCEYCKWWDGDRLYGDCTNETACLSGVTGRTPKDFGCIKWEAR